MSASLNRFTEAAMFVSYVVVSTSLATLVYRERRQLPSWWTFATAGIVLAACGFSRAIEIVAMWFPLIQVREGVKVTTAVASLATAFAVPFLVPRMGRALKEARENDRRLASLSHFTHSLIASSPFATIATDLLGTITSINPAAERMLLYEKGELVGRESALIVLDPQQLEERAAALSAELQVLVEAGISVLTAKPERGLVENSEWRLVRRDGSYSEAQLTVSALAGPTGDMIGLIIVAYDIAERKRVEHISHLAHHDALTGLPSRRLLSDRLEGALDRASRSGGKVGVLMVDLDNFKQVNDMMGHFAGDEMLTIVAKRLQGSARVSDTVARIGGDEFVILIDDLRTVRDAEKIARKLLSELSAPIEIGTDVLSPTASIGISIYPEDGRSAEALLRNADAAMYRVKSAGRNGHRSFATEPPSML